MDWYLSIIDETDPHIYQIDYLPDYSLRIIGKGNQLRNVSFNLPFQISRCVKLARVGSVCIRNCPILLSVFIAVENTILVSMT